MLYLFNFVIGQSDISLFISSIVVLANDKNYRYKFLLVIKSMDHFI